MSGLLVRLTLLGEGIRRPWREVSIQDTSAWVDPTWREKRSCKIFSRQRKHLIKLEFAGKFRDCLRGGML